MIAISTANQIDTPEFKRWFKNSKMVEHGKPKRYFHKTSSDFKVFDDLKVGANDHGYAGAGFYFTPQPLQGLTYGDRTMAVYLSIQNPYIRTAQSWDTDPIDPYKWIPANKVTDHENPYSMAGIKEAAVAWTKMMIHKGYDGFIDSTDPKYGEIVVFKNTQIKSAVGNNGNFDPHNPDITG